MITSISINKDNIDSFVESIPLLFQTEDRIRVSSRLGVLDIRRLDRNHYDWSFKSNIRGMESISQLGSIDERDMTRIKYLAYEILRDVL